MGCAIFGIRRNHGLTISGLHESWFPEPVTVRNRGLRVLGQAFYRICPSVCCAIHGPVWRSVRSSVDSGPALHVGCSLAQLIASLGTLRFLRSLTTHDRPSAPSVSAVEKANSRRHATISHVITEESAYLTLPYVFASSFVSPK